MGDNEVFLDRARQLTVEQKAALCLGGDIWHTAVIPEHGIEKITLSDGPHGLRRQAEGGDHVGIGGSVPATCFPTACALASSWDVELARQIGDAVGVEARAQDVAVVLGPGVNIKRSPLCGRNFEYLSEDPLPGRPARGGAGRRHPGARGRRLREALRGQQPGDRPDAGQRRRRRAHAARDLPARLRAHRRPRRAPWTVMCAYNKINGMYASEHHWLLTELLRDEWGFDGLVMSDWGAVHDRVAAVAAGLDLEMPPDLGLQRQGAGRGRAGRPARRGACSTWPRPGCCSWWTGPPRASRAETRRRRPPRAGPPGRGRVHRAAAQRRRRAAAGRHRHRRGGRRARPHPRYQGAGSSQVNPTRVDTPLDALTAALPDGRGAVRRRLPARRPGRGRGRRADRRGGGAGPRRPT